MNGLHAIYTEKIHHLSCCGCDKQINTNDISHNLSRSRAAQEFANEGWLYKKGHGWYCVECTMKG